jgi:hypothetical protein
MVPALFESLLRDGMGSALNGDSLSINVAILKPDFRAASISASSTCNPAPLRAATSLAKPFREALTMISTSIVVRGIP